jgi:cytosine deaminase
MNVIPGTPVLGLTGVRLPGAPAGRTVDVILDGADVADVLPHDPDRGGNVSSGVSGGGQDHGVWLHLPGYTVFPAAADPHAHLDKALSQDLIDPPAGDLDRAIASWVTAAAEFTEEDILDRARRAALLMLAHGTTAVRSHVDVYPATGTAADPFRGIRALTRLRDELAGIMTLQIVALVPAHTPDRQLTGLAEGALDAGADLVGGAPHLAADPLAQTDLLLDVAERRGVGCDLHTDEFLDAPDAAPRTPTIDRYAARVRTWPADRIRGAGHCCHLSQLDATALDTTAAALQAAGIHVIALPATNLYLQGGDGDGADTLCPQGRGIAPLTALRTRGVAVAAGGDNIRDPFNPTGRADPLETAALLVTAAHQTPEQALDLVTADARAALGLAPAGPVTGHRADLLCSRDPVTADGAPPTVASLIAAAPADRTVIAGGRLAAQTRSTVTVPRLTDRPHLPHLRPVP